MKHLILATAGHVDHGKTALIKALTGTETDRLPEEKARGITIELGFAHLALGDISLGIIDVPGHEDFVKNMVAGVGAIDLALLVIASDDGWMPQTEEHLQILEYLGVKRAVIALTKSDLAAPPFEAVKAELARTVLSDAPLAAVSAKTGDGLSELRNLLAREAAAAPMPRAIGKPRLPVDRVFTLRGIGTVVTGTLTGGKLRRGDAIVVQPGGATARIRALQNHHREIEECVSGMRTALSVPGVEIARGEVVTLSGLGQSSTIADVLVSRSSRLPAETPPLRHGTRVCVHHGSARSSARIFFAGEAPLPAGETAIAELRFETPVFLFAGDRVIVRDSSGQRTLAGALVLEADASAKNFRTESQQLLLRKRSQAPDSADVFARTELERDHMVRRADLLRKSRFSADEIAGVIPSENDLVCDPRWWRDVQTRASKLIDAEHALHSNRVGLELSRLRDTIALEIPEAFDLLVANLEKNGFRRVGESIQRATHQLKLPPQLQNAGDRIRAALAVKPFDPPSRRELAPDVVSQEALRFLRETGAVVEVAPEVVLSREGIEGARKTVTKILRRNANATVSDLRQALGSSRRVVVPLLEYFDRTGLTRRVGDQRVLVSAR